CGRRRHRERRRGARHRPAPHHRLSRTGSRGMSRTVANVRWRGKRPALSVLIPFYRDDPCDLLADLSAEAAVVDGSVEVIVLSDGGGDPDLVARVEAAVKG